MQARNWTFTLNNYEGLLDIALFSDCTYSIYQEEVGESGTPHLQGYLQFSCRKRLAFLRDLVGLEGAHFEVARGTPEENKVYCSKDEGRLGGPYESGEMGNAFGIRFPFRLVLTFVL